MSLRSYASNTLRWLADSIKPKPCSAESIRDDDDKAMDEDATLGGSTVQAPPSLDDSAIALLDSSFIRNVPGVLSKYNTFTAVEVLPAIGSYRVTARLVKSASFNTLSTEIAQVFKQFEGTVTNVLISFADSRLVVVFISKNQQNQSNAANARLPQASQLANKRKAPQDDSEWEATTLDARDEVLSRLPPYQAHLTAVETTIRPMPISDMKKTLAILMTECTQLLDGDSPLMVHTKVAREGDEYFITCSGYAELPLNNLKRLKELRPASVKDIRVSLQAGAVHFVVVVQHVV